MTRSVGPLPYDGGAPNQHASWQLSPTRLIGRRVAIRALQHEGSEKFLNGLIGIVTGLHPIARGWVMLHLDLNEITDYRNWPVPVTLLECVPLPPIRI